MVRPYLPPELRMSIGGTSIACGPNASTMIGAIEGRDGWIGSMLIGVVGWRAGMDRASHAASSAEITGARCDRGAARRSTGMTVAGSVVPAAAVSPATGAIG